MSYLSLEQLAIIRPRRRGATIWEVRYADGVTAIFYGTDTYKIIATAELCGRRVSELRPLN